MQILFVATSLAGIALAVYWMLAGVERGASLEGMPPERTSLTTPSLAGLATCFGVTGYLLTRYTTLGAASRAGLAALVAAAGVAGAVALVTKWAVPSAQRDTVDERYLLQGHLARVTRAIDGPSAAGQIFYELDGTRHAAGALSVDGQPVPAETEVVIERIENGVAYVEPWVRVEERL